MRILIQRSRNAFVQIEGEIIRKINKGIVVLVGFEADDNQADIDWTLRKMVNLRIFDDENGVMNKSLLDVNGDLLIVSQFTLHASTKKGNRPSYIKAAKPEIAEPLYNKFVEMAKNCGVKNVATGKFGADMQVNLINDGPVTIFIDSKNKE